MQTHPPKLMLELAVASLVVVGIGVFVLAGGQIGKLAGAALVAVALIGGVVLDQRGAINIRLAIGAAVGTIAMVGVMIVAIIGIAVYSTFLGPGSGLTYINKTTVPIAIVDHESRSIVAPCSERTIGWSNTWGGDRSTGSPRAEPLPADAYVLSVDSYRPAVDGALRLTFVVTRVGIVQVRGGMSDPRNLPCEGAPPPRPSPRPSSSASPSTR